MKDRGALCISYFHPFPKEYLKIKEQDNERSEHTPASRSCVHTDINVTKREPFNFLPYLLPRYHIL